MSRCYPFPPPGYETKARLDDLSLIIKEKHKHKEKRHKDKDRDKKGKNERKDKDRTDGKHKEDKDRKKKHKDKKEKQKSSEGKKIVGPLENQNGGEKPVPDGKPDDRARDHRILAEMGKRVRNDDMAKDSSCVSMANGQSPLFDAKCPENEEFSYLPGEKRVKIENGYCGVKVPEKRTESQKRNGDGLENENRDKKTKEDKKRKKEKKEEKVKEISSREKIKQGASDGSWPKFCAQKTEDLLKESWDRQGKLPKLKEPVLNEFSHDNGTRPDNMSRPAIACPQVSKNGNCSLPSQRNSTVFTIEKQTVISNQKVNGKVYSAQSYVKDARDMGLGQTANNSAPDPLCARIGNHAISNGFISLDGRKTARPDDEKHNKDSNVNGISEGKRDIPSRPSSSASANHSTAKTLRPCSGNHEISNGYTSPSPVENGRKTVREKEDFKVNGTLEGTKVFPSRPPSAPIKPPKEKAPHPDSKYLSQLLTLPKVELHQYAKDDDDQEWLFGSKGAKKPKLGPLEIESGKHVWAEAIRLEHADVTVLPYVIPY